MSRHAALIVAAGLAVRAFLFPLLDIPASWDGGDSVDYLSGSSGARAPLYSLVASSLGAPLVITLQSAVTVAMAVAAYLVLRRDGERAAFIAGLLLAANPFLPLMEARVLSEVLYGTFVLAAFLVLYRSAAISAGVGAGLLLGLAILTRDTLILLPLAILPFRFRQGMAVCAAAYLLSLPWYVSSEAPSRAGFNLWIGTWERGPSWMDSGIRFPDFAFRSPAEKEELIRARQARDDAPFRRVAVERIATEPLQTATTWAARYPYLWLGTRSELNRLRLDRGSPAWLAFKAGLWGLNFLLLAAGLWGLWRERRRLGLLAVPVVYVALVYLPFHNTEPRYSLMALPFLMIGAAVISWRPARASEAAPAPR